MRKTFFQKITFGYWLTFLLVGALLARLYKITNPIADWHSFRQADTASVTREYVKHGIDLLRPKYHDLSNIQSGENNKGDDNVEGWRMVEFPIVNGVVAALIKFFPFLDLVMISRIASVVASLFSLYFIVMLATSLYGKREGLVAGFFFAFLPYSIYYSRVILPEPFFVAFSLGSLWFYWQYLRHKSVRFIWITGVFFSLALLIKPMAVFFLPGFLGLRLMDGKKISSKDILSIFVLILSVIPLYFWRKWILQFPLGIPASNWLYNGGGEGKRLSPVYNIRLKPAWFRWLFYERLYQLILGMAGIVPFVLGLAPIKNRRFAFDPFLMLMGAGVLGYLIVFAAGNVQHDYYQVLLTPFVAFALARGILLLFDVLVMRDRKVAFICSAALCAVIFVFSWKTVGGFYNINHPDILVAGAAADRLLPQGAKVIAPFGGDTAFLFQTNRTGWPIGFDIDKKIREGATHYISVNYDDEANELAKKYTVVEAKKEYIIIDLMKQK